MNRSLWLLLLVAILVGDGTLLRAAWAADAAQDLLGAARLVCAFTQGVNAGFTPQGGVNVKPPLDPRSPGLSLVITDREKKKAFLLEGAQETPAVFMTTPAGLTAMARYPNGGVALVTVYALYASGATNFYMVLSRHGVGTMPQISQRYGLCRVGADAAEKSPAPAGAGDTQKK